MKRGLVVGAFLAWLVMATLPNIGRVDAPCQPVGRTVASLYYRCPR